VLIWVKSPVRYREHCWAAPAAEPYQAAGLKENPGQNRQRPLQAKADEAQSIPGQVGERTEAAAPFQGQAARTLPLPALTATPGLQA